VKNIYISLFLLFISFWINGCSQKAAYETFRHSDKYNCESIINTEDRIRCQNADRPSYEEYHDYLKKTDQNGL
jgi:hypothetical protein